MKRLADDRDFPKRQLVPRFFPEKVEALFGDASQLGEFVRLCSAAVKFVGEAFHKLRGILNGQLRSSFSVHRPCAAGVEESDGSLCTLRTKACASAIDEVIADVSNHQQTPMSLSTQT